MNTMSNLIARVTRDLKVTYHSTVRDAQKKGNDGWLIDSAEALELRCDLSAIDMAKLYNKLVPEKEVKKFSDRPTACKRLWVVLKEKGEEAIANEPTVVEPVVKPAAAPKAQKEPKPKKAKAESTRKSNMDAKLFPADGDKNPYRANTQSFTTFEMIKKHPGKTFREYAKQGARLNTVRAAIRDKHLRTE